MKKKIIALIVAAGEGTRCNSSIPKQYVELSPNGSALKMSIMNLIKHDEIDEIKVVIHQDHQNLYDQMVYSIIDYHNKLHKPIVGGKTRQESVKIGLENIQTLNPDFVIIHDGCRPFFSQSLLTRLLLLLSTYSGAVPVLDLVDTLKIIDNNVIVGSADRCFIKALQTPQAFRYADLLQCHQQYSGIEQTDDSSLLQHFKLAVGVTAGEWQNIKITTAQDLLNAQLHNAVNTRVGIGYDVHRFTETVINQENFIKICGIEIPYERSIVAHSDGDVALHAITDAILGALGHGDIGEHFPPSDLQWKNKDSSHFVKYAQDLMIKDNFVLANLDLIIICETPKITEFKTQMHDTLADLMQVEKQRVNIKATTTERLGALGRSEGIAAQAIVSIRKFF